VQQDDRWKGVGTVRMTQITSQLDRLPGECRGSERYNFGGRRILRSAVVAMTANAIVAARTLLTPLIAVSSKNCAFGPNAVS
jgi:hypothetical protein